MKVLLIEPGKVPRDEVIGSELCDMQETIGGAIEVVCPWDDPVAIVCAEEGKNLGMTPNRRLETYDILVGTFFLCGLDGKGQFTDLAPELSLKYRQKFQYPEIFIKTNDGHVYCVRDGNEKPAEKVW